jgi:GNAT superfamily N-acetyltransferase
VIQEILLDRILIYAPHFADPPAQLALASAAAHNTRVQLWRLAQAEGEALLLWDKGNNVFYLAGRLAEAGLDELAHLVETEIKASALRDRRPYFRARALAAGQDVAARLFRGLELRPATKRFYAYRQPTPPAAPLPALAGVQFEPIDAGFLDRDHLHNLSWLKTEIAGMWPSPERFCRQGFGVAALLEAAIIGWCTAEYVGETGCGAGVATLAEFENKGIATALAARFVAYGLQRGLRLHWECDAQNIGSIRVAEKVGFELLQTAGFWVGLFQ